MVAPWELPKEAEREEGYKSLVPSPILTKAAFLRPTLDYKETVQRIGRRSWKTRIQLKAIELGALEIEGPFFLP